MSGYTRQSVADIVPTAVVRAAPINAEYNKLRDAFAQSDTGTTGHKHDGTSDEGSYVPLIADLDAKNINAGHHFSANGYPNVRFNEDNIHNQCIYCNQHNSGNLLEYRKGLIAKIGQERYDKLEAESKSKKSYTKEELKNIIKNFKEKCRLLNK